MTVTLHDDQNTFLIIFRPVFPRMRNVSDKIWKENKNVYFYVQYTCFFFENRAFYETGEKMR